MLGDSVLKGVPSISLILLVFATHDTPSKNYVD